MILGNFDEVIANAIPGHICARKLIICGSEFDSQKGHFSVVNDIIFFAMQSSVHPR